jgi:hypothetical protein
MTQLVDSLLMDLAKVEPALLARPDSLRQLHDVRAVAGLLDRLPPGGDGGADVARLHALFDHALASNLVSVVVHYVLEARARCAAPLRQRSARPRTRARAAPRAAFKP